MKDVGTTLSPFGDGLVSVFQCDYCGFRSINKEIVIQHEKLDHKESKK